MRERSAHIQDGAIFLMTPDTLCLGLEFGHLQKVTSGVFAPKGLKGSAQQPLQAKNAYAQRSKARRLTYLQSEKAERDVVTQSER